MRGCSVVSQIGELISARTGVSAAACDRVVSAVWSKAIRARRPGEDIVAVCSSDRSYGVERVGCSERIDDSCRPVFRDGNRDRAAPAIEPYLQLSKTVPPAELPRPPPPDDVVAAPPAKTS